MPDDAAIASPVRDLLALVTRAREAAISDPFGNPVQSVALAISRRMDRGELDLPALSVLVHELRDRAAADRARRLAEYAGPAPGWDALAAEAVAGDWDEVAARLDRPRVAAVFTSHPTFAHPPRVYAALAEAAGGAPLPRLPTHRPERPTLEDEFALAADAVTRGRDALDDLAAALLRAARERFPDRWTEAVPGPVLLATWVGFDTDGRTDIGWWDSLRLRLRLKRMQLVRLAAQCATVPTGAVLAARLEQAAAVVDAQIAACPTGPDPETASRFARALVGGREAALTGPEPLLPLFEDAIGRADPDGQVALAVARAGLLRHGLSLAHVHVRLNAAQIHNVARLRLGLTDPPGDPARRRALLAGITDALRDVRPVPVDTGALLAEQSSAARMAMLVAQIVKHVDGAAPVRFLIAETEGGYTLLAALWLARLFGVEHRVEISPLFETSEALERGERVVEEALRSPQWRAYLRRHGRMCLQFGYSDSGRYVGQLAASSLIERLRLRAADLLTRHGLTDVELVLFDTHGESVGRGAHPGTLADRLAYLSPDAGRQAFARAGVAVREECAFQGGDGYLLFGTPALAGATVARLAERAFAPVPDAADPVYDDPDFAVNFFASIAADMRGLVEDPGYAALLGTFGPALLDPTGSRPPARQSDTGGPAAIRHPRELRAIPNNAVLHQLGWLANTVYGLGDGAARQSEEFAELRRSSPRFRRALDLAAHALARSDLDVLRAVAATLDPGSWLNRAGASTVPGRREALVAVAAALERLDLSARVWATFRRLQADYLRLRAAWPDAPRMPDRLVLLHAVRLAAIQRIWLLAVAVPDFAARPDATHAGLVDRLLRLDVPAVLDLLVRIFPAQPGEAAARDYAEPRGPAAAASYAREHEGLFGPMAELFALVREVSAAVTHEVGAFG